jgi:hypothetical protein
MEVNRVLKTDADFRRDVAESWPKGSSYLMGTTYSGGKMLFKHQFVPPLVYSSPGPIPERDSVDCEHAGDSNTALQVTSADSSSHNFCP